MPKKRQVYRRSKKTRQQVIDPTYFVYGLMIGLFIVFAFLFSNVKLAKQTAKKEQVSIVAKATPTQTPSPTLTPTPTPIPKPLGFCLYVPVLFYHHVQPQAQAAAKGQTSLSVDNGIFDGQMQYLSSHGYNSITVEQLVTALRTHSALPPKSIAITFDDGYNDNADFAAPILSKYGLHANLMLATGLVGGSDYLSWDQIQNLKNQGWFFTDHTWSHYAINHGTTDKIQYEILTAKQQIQDHLGQNVDIFTYPYGSFNNLSIQLLQQDGFVGAFTTNPGMYQCENSIMALPRTRIGNAPLSAYGL